MATLQSYKKEKSFETRRASLSWRLFDEQMLTKPTEIYGCTAFNTSTKRITKFIAADTADYPIDMATFAWQVDPLAAKYPSISPYSAFGGNPILFVDNDGRELTLGGKDVNKTKEALLSMLSSSDIRNKVTIDENNKVSFNTVGLSNDQIKDNSVVLLSNLVTAKEQYLFEVGTVAKGVDRDDNMSKEYVMYNQGNKGTANEGPVDMNFSTTDRGDEKSSLARGVWPQNYERGNMKPKEGFDGKATISPEIKDIEKSKNKPYGSIVFHTLQEVYTRTHDQCNMPQAHQQAIDCEKELPNGHPAKSNDPGQIGTKPKE